MTRQRFELSDVTEGEREVLWLLAEDERGLFEIVATRIENGRPPTKLSISEARQIVRALVDQGWIDGFSVLWDDESDRALPDKSVPHAALLAAIDRDENWLQPTVTQPMIKLRLREETYSAFTANE